MCVNNCSHISPNSNNSNKVINDGITLDNAIVDGLINGASESKKTAENGSRPTLDTYRTIFHPIKTKRDDVVPEHLKLSFQKYWRKQQYFSVLDRISGKHETKEKVGSLTVYDKSIYYVNECVRLANILIDLHRKANYKKIELLCDHEKENKFNPRCEDCQEKYLELLNGSPEGIIQKSVTRLLSCGRYIAARELPDTGEAFKIGTKGCKHPLCPFCNFKKSTRRKQDASDFFFPSGNALTDEFIGKYFFHLVLPVRHGKNSDRRGNYVSEDLIENFKRLRDHNSVFKKLWKKYVYGGYYSCELKVLGYLNGHLHCLLITNENIISRKKGENGLWERDENGAFINTPNLTLEKKKRGRGKGIETTYHNFEDELKARWKQLTGDSDIIHIEPIYYKDENDNKVYYSPHRQDIANGEGLKRAMEETLKYTLKGGIDDLVNIGTEYEEDCKKAGRKATKQGKAEYILEFIASVVKPSKKYFGTFGKLYGRGIFSKSNENKDEVKVSDEELVSPTTGQVYHVDETRIVIGSITRNFDIVTVDDTEGNKVQVLNIVDSSNLVICQTVSDATEALNSCSYSYLEKEAYRGPKHFVSTRQFREQANQKSEYGFRLTQPFKKLPALIDFEKWVANGIYDASLLPQDNLEHRDRVRKLHAAYQNIQFLKDTSKAELWGCLVDELQYNFPMKLRTNQNTSEEFLLNSLKSHLDESQVPF